MRLRLWWKEYQAEMAERERQEAAASELRQAQHQAELAELKASYARLEHEIAQLREKAKQLDKILYLPKGRVRHCEHRSLQFDVSDRIAEMLNRFAVSIFDAGGQPFLDLEHRAGARTFDISKFEFEPDGVFAHGRYTPLGRVLHNAGRISGVSIASFVTASNNKPVFVAIECEISEEDAQRAPLAPMTLENQANMGGVLIDGRRSAIQRCETPSEAWKRLLAATQHFPPD